MADRDERAMWYIRCKDAVCSELGISDPTLIAMLQPSYESEGIDSIYSYNRKYLFALWAERHHPYVNSFQTMKQQVTDYIKLIVMRYSSGKEVYQDQSKALVHPDIFEHASLKV